MKITPRDQFKYRNAIIDNVLAKYNFPPRQIRVLMHIIRKTLGFNQTHFYASVRDIAKATGLQIPHAHSTLKALEEKNIIATRPTTKKTHIELNVDYMSWKLKESKSLFTDNALLPPGVTPAVTPQGNGVSEENRLKGLEMVRKLMKTIPS